MASGSKRVPRPNRLRLKPAQLRHRCDPAVFDFRTTAEMKSCPINIIGQDRAQKSLAVGLTVADPGYNVFVTGEVGGGRSTVVKRMLAQLDLGQKPPDDLAYVHNFENADEPRRLVLPAGQGKRLKEGMEDFVESLSRDLPGLFESDEYRERRSAFTERVARKQKARLKKFEKRVESAGFVLVQVEMGPLVRPQLTPLVAGNPVPMDQLEGLVEQGKFKREDLETLQANATKLTAEMEALGKVLRSVDRQLRHQLADLDRELARPLIEESAAELRAAFDVPGLEGFLDHVVEDVLEHLDAFRQSEPGEAKPDESAPDRTRYSVNVIVDNSQTKGRPVIWETSPTYRNLFGTIDKVRAGSGEWETDHSRIRAGSLLRANGGFLVLDAMDVLVEAGVWAALKRTLRNRTVEIQGFDPFYVFAGLSIKPEPAPINVKVLMIGTRAIYRLLYGHDEDFKKIFKVKAELAMHTPLSEEELRNYACFVYKKCNDDDLLPFHRDAVAAIVEQGVRLAGKNDKLTTRFTEIADLIRESGYWAAKGAAKAVKAEHVDTAVEHRAYRVNLIEDLLRARIADGLVLLDLEGEKVGQVNGLAVLDLGDHAFAQPSRITATTAMGRKGILDLDREAKLSGSIHTKGVLILTGYLRSRFAQDKPLTLTASLCFEQNYGEVDGDSASSAELYALLSSLAGVPVRQGVAVTGSVNQRGEIQPIGGVNEKIEGFFDLCSELGLTGEQGVMIPTRNLSQLMLRKDLVAAARQGKFHVWAVSTIEEGLQVLTGVAAGTKRKDGHYPEDSIFGRADAKLRRFADSVAKYEAR